MKILVPMKQVVDPEQCRRIRTSCDGRSLTHAELDLVANPFDEYALEAALRLTEEAPHSRTRLGNVVVATLGTAGADSMLQLALSLGAAEAIRIDVADQALDASLVAQTLVRLTELVSPDVLLMGKQSVDGDGHEVPERTAALLGWPLASGAIAITRSGLSSLVIERETDGGILELEVRVPAVVSVDLRIVSPNAIRRSVNALNGYPWGVRFATLPAIIAAKRKAITVYQLDALLANGHPLLKYVRYELVPPRRPCVFFDSSEELAEQLAKDQRLF